tara:strand:+ start:31490 stop:32020 length:531 start_codon:yes stop_codon:yes gene_type:complete
MIIGIDPGARGGIAILENGELQVSQMPIVKSKWKNKDETNIDALALIAIFQAAIVRAKAAKDLIKIYIEDVHAIQKASGSSKFKMGYNLAMIHAVLDIVFGDYLLVQPKEWQIKTWRKKDLVFNKDAQKSIDTKKTSINAAVRHYPGESFIPKGKRTPQDGLCDASLIAKYGELYE